jgi:type II restriction enzyme
MARVITEKWCAENVYCAACDSDTLCQQAANAKAIDFRCRNCLQSYQLKGQKHLNLRRVVDGAFSSMLTAVKNDLAPNLLILNYSPTWTIVNLLLVPSIFFTASVLEKRKPLSPSARRAGWIGCNILLQNIPDDGKIPLVQNESIVSPHLVREKYKETNNLRSLNWDVRGWTLDVLQFARRIGSPEFVLEDLYRYEAELQRLHPNNQNIRPKIRQQLQVLRDLSLLDFLGAGKYRLRRSEIAASH